MRAIYDFTETKEKVEITMNGWDGTGYDGEGKTMNVWVNKMVPNAKYVCKWMPSYEAYCILLVNFDRKHEKTGLPTVEYVNSFDRSKLSK